MTYFLRAIYNNVLWDTTQPSWVPKDDIQSCIICDLQAQDNSLSLWEIVDGESNLPQVITALASTRKTALKDFDYALLEQKYIDPVYFTCVIKHAKTPYTEINSYHRDLKNVPLSKIPYFAHLLYKYGIFRRMGWKEVQSNLSQAFNNNKLNLNKIKTELKKEFGLN